MFSALWVVVTVGFHQVVPGNVGWDYTCFRPAPAIGAMAAGAGGGGTGQLYLILADIGRNFAATRAGAFKVYLFAVTHRG